MALLLQHTFAAECLRSLLPELGDAVPAALSVPPCYTHKATEARHHQRSRRIHIFWTCHRSVPRWLVGDEHLHLH